MSLTIDLPEDILARVNEAAAAEGRDPATYVAALLASRFAVAANVPAHLDPRRFKTMDQFIQDARERHGFAADWGTKPVTLTEEQWAAIDSVNAELYPDFLGLPDAEMPQAQK